MSNASGLLDWRLRARFLWKGKTEDGEDRGAQGDVVMSFRKTPEGRTVDVTPISGPAMLQGIAVENVKAWHFKPTAELAEQAYQATFQFRLNPPDDGYDDSQPMTKALLDGTGRFKLFRLP